MAGTLYHPQAGDDAWQSFVDAVFDAADEGFFRDETGSNTTGALTTNATYASATTFTVTGDATTIYVVGRRIRIVHGGGTSFGRVLASSFSSPSTTVTIGNVTSGPVTMTTPITSVAISLFMPGNAGNETAVEGPDPILHLWGL